MFSTHSPHTTDQGDTYLVPEAEILRHVCIRANDQPSLSERYLIYSLPCFFDWWWQSAWYRLIGTIEHRGENTEGGHYVACTLGPDGFWREYDDTRVVSRIKGGSVEGALEMRRAGHLWGMV